MGHHQPDPNVVGFVAGETPNLITRAKNANDTATTANNSVGDRPEDLTPAHPASGKDRVDSSLPLYLRRAGRQASDNTSGRLNRYNYGPS